MYALMDNIPRKTSTDTGPDLFDVCRHRHGGAAPSVEAWERTKDLVQDDHYTIMRLIQTRRQKGRGLTAKAYARYKGWQKRCRVELNTVSGRFAELKNAGRIVRHATARRNKCGIWILATINAQG